MRASCPASAAMSFQMLRALSRSISSTVSANGARSACSMLEHAVSRSPWSSSLHIGQQSPSISVASSQQGTRHGRAWTWAAWPCSSRALSSQANPASSSQSITPDTKPSSSQKPVSSPPSTSTASQPFSTSSTPAPSIAHAPAAAAAAAAAVAHGQPALAQGQSEEDSIQAIRARIFGEPIQLGERTGRRALARKLKGAELASWYYVPPFVPGLHNEAKEYVKLRKLNKRQKRKVDEDAGAGAKKKKK